MFVGRLTQIMFADYSIVNRYSSLFFSILIVVPSTAHIVSAIASL